MDLNLDTLYYHLGISGDYLDYRGQARQIPASVREHALGLMGVADDEGTRRDKQYQLDIAPWLYPLPAFSVVRGQSLSFYLPAEHHYHQVTCRVELESGGEFQTLDLPIASLTLSGNYQYQDVTYVRYQLPLDGLAVGYHRVWLMLDDERTYVGDVAVCPNRCYLGEQRARRLGLNLQLYTLRLTENLGVGDFADLRALIKHLAPLGVDLIGLNPLAALAWQDEHSKSPYAPSDRRFLNPLYIDVAGACDALGIDKPADALVPDFELRARELRETSSVEWRQVAKFKYAVLAELYQEFVAQDSAWLDHWRDFMGHNGALLRSFCDFEVQYNPFGEACSGDTEFHGFLQWLATQQLEACQAFAIEQGMSVGLMADLPVASVGSGHEIATNPDLFVQNADIGAPPDPFSDTGQNWGMPPLNPSVLRARHYDHFISLLRSAMCGAGALRLDHAMWLQRVWWCVQTELGPSGLYVYQNVEEMLALLALESQRNQCQIIGEDLGVVPDDFRAMMHTYGMLGNALFYFATDVSDCFLPAQAQRDDALLMVANHDVPPLRAWWQGLDIDQRLQYGLVDEHSAKSQRHSRAAQKKQLIALLHDHDVWPDLAVPQACDEALCLAIYRFCAKGASPWVILQLDDLVGADTPVNIPGTFLEYDNWSRKLPGLDLADIQGPWSKLFEQLALDRASV